MDVFEYSERGFSGLVVEGHIDELIRLVPAAWQRLKESRSTRDLEYAAFSRQLPDGKCREVLGVYGSTEPLDPALDVETTEIPAGTWVVTTHEGPNTAIYETFGKMQQWALKNGYLDTGEKTDCGYRLDGEHSVHTLGIRVLPQTR